MVVVSYRSLTKGGGETYISRPPSIKSKSPSGSSPLSTAAFLALALARANCHQFEGQRLSFLSQGMRERRKKKRKTYGIMKLESGSRERHSSVVDSVCIYVYPLEFTQSSVETELRICEDFEQRFCFIFLPTECEAFLKSLL